jgi:hypothetical protein
MSKTAPPPLRAEHVDNVVLTMNTEPEKTDTQPPLRAEELVMDEEWRTTLPPLSV